MKNVNTRDYRAREIIDAINAGQPDVYAVMRNPNTHQLCLIYMRRYLPLARFEMSLQRDDGEVSAANADTMGWKLGLSTDPDKPASARLVLLDQQDTAILSSVCDCFSGQLWLIAEGRLSCHPATMHGVFDWEKSSTVGSLQIDKSPILAEHWRLSAQCLRPAWHQETMDEAQI